MHIYKNQQILITGYDIYNTIGNLLFGDNYEYIISVVRFNSVYVQQITDTTCSIYSNIIHHLYIFIVNL